jgi:plastocyanin
MRARAITRTVLAGALALASLGGMTPATAATRRVLVVDNFFQPAARRVPRGTTVRWVNQGQNRHTTTSVKGLWDATLDPGEAFARRFRRVGRFRYYCEVHDGMVGRIRVVA